MAIELNPNQIKAIRELKNGSILKGKVGSGKSRTALTYYFTKVCLGMVRINGQGDYSPMQKPKDLYILTTAKKRDSKEWEKEASDFALSNIENESLQGVVVTVDSWNNIGKYVLVHDAFFIFDEQRLVGSGAWAKAFLKIAKLNQWLVLTATPGDTWSDYIPIFLAHGLYKNRTKFTRDHIVFKKSFASYPVIDRYVETGKLERFRRDITVEMPDVRHTSRHSENIVVDYDKKQFVRVWKDRWHIYEDRPLRDIGEMFRVARRLVNTDVSRLAAVMELNEVHPKLIIFYNFDSELTMLRLLGETLDIEVAEWNGHKHEDIPVGNRWIYLVQYTAGAEGWNCTSTDTIVFWSLHYSYKIFEQAKGRIDRMNTPFHDLYYYILRSGSAVDSAINNSLARKETFNEAGWAKKEKVVLAQ